MGESQRHWNHGPQTPNANYAPGVLELSEIRPLLLKAERCAQRGGASGTGAGEPAAAASRHQPRRVCRPALIMPGEVAPSHHNQSTLRFYRGRPRRSPSTSARKCPGDFMTRSGWHDHGNLAMNGDCRWSRFAAGQLSGCGFAEDYPQEQQRVTRKRATACRAMLPICCRCAIRWEVLADF